METTDRTDVGVDLNAPQRGEESQEVWGYALVGEVREGDVVVHYRARPQKAIVGWSRVVGLLTKTTYFGALTEWRAGEDP